MNIPPETMSKAIKDFKASGICSAAILRRKHKISLEMAIMIRDSIEKRFPNLWREGKEKFMKDYVGHR